MTKITVSNAKKFAMKFFRSEMTPPSFGNFPEIHPFWRRQASLICSTLFKCFVTYQWVWLAKNDLVFWHKVMEMRWIPHPWLLCSNLASGPVLPCHVLQPTLRWGNRLFHCFAILLALSTKCCSLWLTGCSLSSKGILRKVSEDGLEVLLHPQIPKSPN